MRLTSALDTKTGSILVSIIFGLGLAALFRQTCKGDRCVVIKSPSMKEIDNVIYRYNKECYKYTPDMIPCPGQKKNTSS